jgi:lipoate synthase
MGETLYQIMGLHRAHTLPERKPPWLKVKAPGGANYIRLKGMMRELNLHTVCEEAHCPNVGECWEHGTATFMILGDVCTRNCAYCAVAHGRPPKYDIEEPSRVAQAVAEMRLQHAVITSVDRDDLPDFGAYIFAETIVRSTTGSPRARSRCWFQTSRGARTRSARCSTRGRRSTTTTPRRCRASTSAVGRAVGTSG